ncbi:BlaI/MecI/CopY family transcriptional regulator [Longimicrobium sp.]|uniref:BlaI/MecI/CopY family transcriptional regulator n=1 Tax=Longimicrobium sp. TaxID=2029185 RepID=UPI002B5284F3|nr:BlaI/MecI/CopY family transcriptional regulator [Longimicrobium sp.]HSU15801.1 BlaI/MecI/CopY family transcriptional regulator [Longimicrobium sp.]
MTHEPPLPTEGELRLLRVLWQRGPSTVREVLDALPGGGDTGYTTALKLLQIMHAKGLVIRDETNRTHVYAAAVPPESTQRRLVADLVERAFGGSAHQLVLQALSPQLASPAELAQIRALLDTLGTGDRPEEEG